MQRRATKPLSPQCFISVPPPSSPAPFPDTEFMRSATISFNEELYPKEIEEEAKSSKQGTLKVFSTLTPMKKGWKSKFIKVIVTETEKKLFLYSSAEKFHRAAKPKQILCLSDPVRSAIIDRTLIEGDTYKNTFSVITTDGIIHLGARSHEERLEWVSFLSIVIFPPLKDRSLSLLPDEFILQEVHCSTFACTGKTSPLYLKSPSTTHSNRCIEVGSASFVAGTKFPLLRTSEVMTGESAVSMAALPHPADPEISSFTHTFRSKTISDIGKEESSSTSSYHQGEAAIKLTNTKYQQNNKTPLKVLFWVTNYRIIIRYQKRQIQESNVAAKMAFISMPLDSCFKLSLHVESVKNYGINISDRFSVKKGYTGSVGKQYQRLTLHCRDFRSLDFCFDNETYPEHVNSLKMLMDILTHKTNANSRSHSTSFVNSLPVDPLLPTPSSSPQNELDHTTKKVEYYKRFHYQFQREKQRQGISSSKWRETHHLSIHKQNESYTAKTLLYKHPLLVPNNVEEESIRSAANFRSGGLFLHLNWKHPKKDHVFLFSCLNRVYKQSEMEMNGVGAHSTGTTSWEVPATQLPLGASSHRRSMKVSLEFIEKESEKKRKQEEADGKVITESAANVKPSQLQFINFLCKPDPNQAVEPHGFIDEVNYIQKYECSLQHMNLPSQKNINQSFHALYSTICGVHPIPSSSPPSLLFDRIEACQWMQHTNTFLSVAIELSSMVDIEQCLVLQCNPEEYYSIIIIRSLILLLVDPYYRSLDGFCVLLQKEWFSNIVSHATHSIGSLQHNLYEEDSFFVPYTLFLDVTWQVLELFPRSFEFNSKFLVFLADSLYTGTLHFRIYLAHGSPFQMGHNLNSPSHHSPVKGHYSLKRDIGNQSTQHPLLFSPGQMESGIWDIIYQGRLEFLNPLFVKNTKLKHSILHSNVSFPLNCWFPYYLRFFEWDSTSKFYKAYHNLQQISGRGKISIDVQGYRLAMIPLEAANLIHLRDINFSYNFLTSVPQFLAILPCLTILSLEGNYISSFLEDKMLLPNTILVLNLNFNRITNIPSSIKKLSRLEELHLRGNQIKTIKNGLAALTKLKLLDVGYNQLADLPDVFSSLRELRILSVQDNYLKVLPPSLKCIHALLYLNVAHNQLTENASSLQAIKAGISQSLEKLNVSRNHNFDNSFYFQIINLKMLFLREMSLHTLPTPIGQLKKLQVLDLKGNHFTQFPFEILPLTALHELNLDQNQITSITWDIKDLSRLHTLLLRNNNLDVLAIYSISGLPLLRKLDISHNFNEKQHGLVIGSLFRCIKLEELRVNSSPWWTGSHLSELIQSQHKRAKEELSFRVLPVLMFLGSSNTGKSMLAKWIQARFNEMNENSSKSHLQFDFMAPTEGIDIHSHQLQQKEIASPSIWVNLWDCSGNPNFLCMQDYFMSTTGFYVVSFDWKNRHEEMESQALLRWLHLIGLNSPHGSVALVGTFMEMNNAEYQKAQDEKKVFLSQLNSRRELKARFEFIFLVNLSTKSLVRASHIPSPFVDVEESGKINASKQLPHSQILSFEHFLFSKLVLRKTSRAFIDFYSIVNGEFKKRAVPVFSEEELLDILVACNVNVLEGGPFIQSLVECGVLMKVPTMKYTKVIYVKPKWLSKVLGVLNPGELAHYTIPNTGLLNESSIEQCWRPPQFPKPIHHHIFCLLQKMGVLFQIPKEDEQKFNHCEFVKGRVNRVSSLATTKATVLVPSNFTSSRPSELLKEKLLATICTSTTTFSVDLFCVAPLVSRMMAYFISCIIPAVLWRDGILFHNDSQESVLVEFLHKNCSNSLTQIIDHESLLIKISVYASTGILGDMNNCVMKGNISSREGAKQIENLVDWIRLSFQFACAQFYVGKSLSISQYK